MFCRPVTSSEDEPSAELIVFSLVMAAFTASTAYCEPVSTVTDGLPVLGAMLATATAPVPVVAALRLPPAICRSPDVESSETPKPWLEIAVESADEIWL